MALNLNPDRVCSIIQKARIFHAQVVDEFPDETLLTTDDGVLHDFSQHASDLTYQEAVVEINQLEPDEQVQLVALMYLGRGDFDVSEWEQALQLAQNHWTNKTGEYLLSRPLVADYLEEGLLLFGFSCQE